MSLACVLRLSLKLAGSETRQTYIIVITITGMIIICVIAWVICLMTPDELHWKLFALISGIYIKSRRLAEESLKPLNVTWSQFGALFHLSLEDRVTQRELAGRLESDTTTVMVICDSLERKGWLNRVKDPRDRRVNRLVLTAEGRSVFEKAYPLMMAGYKLFVDAISQKRIVIVLPILEELYRAINEHYQGELKA